MSNLARISLASLAVLFALTAGFGASALATSGSNDGHGGIALAAPKGTHKPKPGTTPVPTPAPTRRPAATPRPTPKPTPKPTSRPRTAAPAPKPKPKPTIAELAPAPSPASATEAAALTTPHSDDRGLSVSVLSIGEQPLTIAVGIVALAGVLLFGAWYFVGRGRPTGSVFGRFARAAAGGAAFTAVTPEPVIPAPLPPPPPAALPVPAAPAEEAVPRRRRDALRKLRGSAQPPPTEPPASRAARFDEVFSTSPMRRVVRDAQVVLLNVPHEVYGIPLTQIASGREVELIENRDRWARVRTPWGEEGWVPATALGT
jgi:hypothetical protein